MDEDMGLVAFINDNSPDVQQADATDLAEEEVEEDDEIEVKRTRVTDTMKILIRYHSHGYNIRGRHDHFRYLTICCQRLSIVHTLIYDLCYKSHRTAKDLMAIILQMYGYRLPNTTAYTIIAKEKTLMEQEIAEDVLQGNLKAFHTKVDIVKLLSDYKEAQASVNDHNEQPPLFGKLGRPYLFHPSYYPDLIRRL
jgi:hypothetical protein